jgi:serine/threonine protein kinase
MAPEQISDQFNVKPDGRADIFSLGTVFYEMITGKHPFLGADDLKTMRNIVHTPALPVRDIDPEIPAEIERVVLSMLEKDPRNRCSGAKEVYDRLHRFLHHREKTGTMPALNIPKPQTAPEGPPPGSDSMPPTPAAALSPAAASPASPASSSPAPAAPAAKAVSISRSALVGVLVMGGIAFLIVGALIGYMLSTK